MLETAPCFCTLHWLSVPLLNEMATQPSFAVVAHAPLKRLARAAQAAQPGNAQRECAQMRPGYGRKGVGTFRHAFALAVVEGGRIFQHFDVEAVVADCLQLRKPPARSHRARHCTQVTGARGGTATVACVWWASACAVQIRMPRTRLTGNAGTVNQAAIRRWHSSRSASPDDRPGSGSHSPCSSGRPHLVVRPTQVSFRSMRQWAVP